MINSPWDKHLQQKPKSWQNPLRVFFITACLIMLMLVGFCVQEVRPEVVPEPPKVQKVPDYKGFHPLPGTVGDRRSGDIGTMMVQNTFDFTIRVCMGEDNASFQQCTILERKQYEFFYGVTAGRKVVAWSALSHARMDSGAFYTIIKQDDLYRWWFERKMITGNLTNAQIAEVKLPFLSIQVTTKFYKNEHMRGDRA